MDYCIQTKNLFNLKTFNLKNPFSMCLEILPEAVEDIIYKFQHQMKYATVMDDLKIKVEQMTNRCSFCSNTYLTFHTNKCVSHDFCENTFCEKCIRQIIRDEYEMALMDNVDIRHMGSFVKNITEYIECDYCRHLRIREEERENDHSGFDNSDFYDFDDNYNEYYY